MFPALVMRDAEIDLDERPPFRALGFAHQVHSGLGRRFVGLASVAGNAGANNVLPSGRAATVARHDMVKIQVFTLEHFAAVLAGIPIPLKDVVAGEFDLFFWKPVKDSQQNDAGDADLEGDRVDAVRVGFLCGEVAPAMEIVGLESAVFIAEDDLSLAFEKQSEGTPD